MVVGVVLVVVGVVEAVSVYSSILIVVVVVVVVVVLLLVLVVEVVFAMLSLGKASVLRWFKNRKQPTELVLSLVQFTLLENQSPSLSACARNQQDISVLSAGTSE